MLSSPPHSKQRNDVQNIFESGFVCVLYVCVCMSEREREREERERERKKARERERKMLRGWFGAAMKRCLTAKGAQENISEECYFLFSLCSDVIHATAGKPWCIKTDESHIYHYLSISLHLFKSHQQLLKTAGADVPKGSAM